MSIVNNQLVVTAAAALGIVVNGDPICESLLDNVAVSEVAAAEVTVKGKCIVIVNVPQGGVHPADVFRPVASSAGDVKLFADGAAVVAMAKKSNLPGGQAVRIVKMAVNNPVGDPIAALKAQHKAAAREATAAAKPAAELAQKIGGATSLGWNNDPVGSPTRAEYQDLIARQETVAEWKTAIDARVAALAAALTAAGISPVTYLPLP